MVELTNHINRTRNKGASYGWGIRHLQIAVMAVAMFVTSTLRINLSVAIVAMVRYENQTTPELAETYEWGEDIQGYILSSFFWGYFILQVPAGILTTKFGGHRFLCFSILGSSMLTILTPQCAYIGGWFLVCINRMFQGMCQVENLKASRQRLLSLCFKDIRPSKLMCNSPLLVERLYKTNLSEYYLRFPRTLLQYNFYALLYLILHFH